MSTAEETWLFDLGNSRAKLARLVQGAPGEVAALAWDAPDFAAALRGQLARWPRADAVWIASVAAPERAQRVRTALANLPSASVRWLQTPRAAGGVTHSYARPERLGIDRFLAMLAAHAHTSGACVVVGCGTALTLDALAANGQHAEGLIALAPAGALRALQAGTAIAVRNPDAFAEGAADDTARALQAGCWASAGALVEWFAQRAQQRDGAQTVWLHGGWSRELAAWLARDGLSVELLDDAVLHGLAAWAAADAVESGAFGR